MVGFQVDWTWSHLYTFPASWRTNPRPYYQSWGVSMAYTSREHAEANIMSRDEELKNRHLSNVETSTVEKGDWSMYADYLCKTGVS